MAKAAKPQPPDGKSRINAKPKPLKTSSRKWMGQINIDPMAIVMRLDELPEKQQHDIKGKMSTFIRDTRKKTLHLGSLELDLTRAEVNGALLILQQRTSMRKALQEDIGSKTDSEKRNIVDQVSSTIIGEGNMEAIIALHRELEAHLASETSRTIRPQILLSWETWMLERLYGHLGRALLKTKK